MRGIELEGIGRAVSVAPAMGRFPALIITSRVEMLREKVSRRAEFFPRRREYIGFSAASVIAEAEAIVGKNSSMLPRHSREGGNPIKHNIYGSRIKYGMTKGSERFLEKGVSPEPMVVWLPGQVTLNRVEWQPAVLARPQVEVRPAILSQTSTPPEKKTQVEEVVENTVEVEEEKRNKVMEEQVVEESEEQMLKLILDDAVLEQRFTEFETALKEAEQEVAKMGGEGIEGWRIIKFLPSEYEGNRSGIVKKSGPDGSRVEAIEEIAGKKFSSIPEARKQIMVTLLKKEPVKKGKEGKSVGNEAIARVRKFLFVKFIPVEEVASRIVRKITKKTVKEVPVVNPSKRVEDGSIQTQPLLAQSLLVA